MSRRPPSALFAVLVLAIACSDGRAGDPAADAAVSADAAGADRPAMDRSVDQTTQTAPDVRDESDVRDDAAGAGLSADEFMNRYCALLAPCCSRVGQPLDGVACRALVREQAVKTFRPATAEACLGVLRASVGADAFCDGGFAAAWSCERVFTDVIASKHLGESCAQNEDCLITQANVSCGRVGTGPGRCQAKVIGKEGDMPCAGTVDHKLTVPSATLATAPAKVFLCDVADGLWCDDDSHACTRAKAAGAACAHFGECGATQRCDDATNKCAPRLADGQTCDVDEACQSAFCREDNKCGTPPAIDARLARLCGQ